MFIKKFIYVKEMNSFINYETREILSEKVINSLGTELLNKCGQFLSKALLKLNIWTLKKGHEFFVINIFNESGFLVAECYFLNGGESFSVITDNEFLYKELNNLLFLFFKKKNNKDILNGELIVYNPVKRCFINPDGTEFDAGIINSIAETTYDELTMCGIVDFEFHLVFRSKSEIETTYHLHIFDNYVDLIIGKYRLIVTNDHKSYTWFRELC